MTNISTQTSFLQYHLRLFIIVLILNDSWTNTLEEINLGRLESQGRYSLGEQDI